MSGRAITEKVVLEVLHCAECAIPFAFPETFEQQRRSDHRLFYCPNGHTQHYPAKSDAEQAQDRADELARRLASRDDDLRAEQMAHSATKGQLTKAKKRADNGVCQHCHRSFVNVARHVSHMHPEATS